MNNILERVKELKQAIITLRSSDRYTGTTIYRGSAGHCDDLALAFALSAQTAFVKSNQLQIIKMAQKMAEDELAAINLISEQ